MLETHSRALGRGAQVILILERGVEQVLGNRRESEGGL
jgi:hypothetical protein